MHSGEAFVSLSEQGKEVGCELRLELEGLRLEADGLVEACATVR